MLNLSGENVQKAWEDYKGFLQGMGEHLQSQDPVRNSYLKRMEQAFKMGFVMGEASNSQAPDQEPEKKKKVIRNRGAIRTPAQIQADTNFIANLLKNRGPMQLKDITKSLNKTTGPKWHEKSASSFLAKSMEINPNIKKVGYGVYGYAE